MKRSIVFRSPTLTTLKNSLNSCFWCASRFSPNAATSRATPFQPLKPGPGTQEGDFVIRLGLIRRLAGLLAETLEVAFFPRSSAPAACAYNTAAGFTLLIKPRQESGRTGRR